MSGYLVSLVPLLGINVILALALNVIAGFCGQISLGQAAFFGIGAYTAALLALAGWSFWSVLPVVTLVAGLSGALVGLVSLRVRDDFLAVTTIAVNFLVLGIARKNSFFGGEVGLAGIPSSGMSQAGFALLVSAFAAVVVAFSLYLRRSWLGFAFSSIAEDEWAARAIAVPVPAYKLAAFFIGSAMSGVAGFLYCYYARFITPDSFGFLLSVAILSMVVIGGIGSVAGVTVAAILLTLFPEAFRFAGEYRQLIFGALLLLAMRFYPGGLSEVATLSREAVRRRGRRAT